MTPQQLLDDNNDEYDNDDPCCRLLDLWTDLDTSTLEDLLNGTAQILPSLINFDCCSRSSDGDCGILINKEGDRDKCIRIVHFGDVETNNQIRSIQQTEYWSEDDDTIKTNIINALNNSSSSNNNGSSNAIVLLSAPIPSPEVTTKSNGGPIGRIDFLQYSLLEEGSKSPSLSLRFNNRYRYYKAKYPNQSKAQAQKRLENLAKRLGKVLTQKDRLQTSTRKLSDLEVSNRRLLESQRIAKIGQWELDLTNNHLYWSDEIYSLFRVDPNEFGASYEAFLNAIHPDDRNFVDASYTNSLKTKKPYNILHRLRFVNNNDHEKSETGGVEEEILWVNEICRTEYDSNGNPLYSVGIVQDVTELKQAQEMDRLKSAFLANMSHEIRTPLNAVLGYTDLMLMEDNNNSGNNDSSSASSSGDHHHQALSAQNIEYLKTIRNSGELLMTVVSDILDISKIEAGQLRLESKPFALRNILRMVGDSAKAYQSSQLGSSSSSSGKQDKQKQHCRIECISPPIRCNHNNHNHNNNDRTTGSSSNDDDEGIIEDCIVGDSSRICQVLSNLLTNAVKFSKDNPEGLVEYGVSLVGSNGGGGDHHESTTTTKMLEFYVSDNGVGIPEEKQQLIFEAFHQVHPSRDSHELGGTGLGLTISKRLVEMMGGEMRLESSTDATNHGTVVRFSLPYRPSATTMIAEATTKEPVIGVPPNVTPPIHQFTPDSSRKKRDSISSQSQTPSLTEASASSSSTSSAASQSLPAGKILVVDDNRVNLKLAVRLVNRLGYETETATNGKEAVEAFRSSPPSSIQLILMDKEMPVMDGLEAVREIRSIEAEMNEIDESRADDATIPPLHVPVVALTAAAYREDREACLAAGCDQYLTKPVKREALQEILSAFLSPSHVSADASPMMWRAGAA